MARSVKRERWSGAGPTLARHASAPVDGSLRVCRGSLALRPIDDRESEPRGDHVMRSEPRGAHVMKGHVLTDEPRGAHVNASDPLRSVEERALHATQVESIDALLDGRLTLAEAPVCDDSAVAATGVAAPGPRRQDVRNGRRAARRTARQTTPTAGKRRWGLAPVVGAAGGLVLCAGGGAAFAYMAGSSASNDTSTVSAVSIKVAGTTGSADLLPGRAGAAYFTLHNPNSFAVSFDQVASGATVVSDDSGLCASDEVSVAPTLPFNFPTPVTVSPGGTSGTQSIPGLVELAPDAPSTCQGVTFTVTFTLSGQSS